MSITTVLIGLGNIAHGYEDMPEVAKRFEYPTHFSVLKSDDRFSLVGVSDPDSDARNAFLKKSKDVSAFETHTELLQKTGSDLAIITSPTNTHVAIAHDVIDIGIKALLLEKPLDYSYSASKALIERAEKEQVLVMVNYTRRFEPTYVKLKQAILSGTFGDCNEVRVTYKGGIYNTASHAINLLEYFFGDISHTQLLKKYTNDVDPSVDFNISFNNGIQAFFEIGDEPFTLKFICKTKTITIKQDVSQDFEISTRSSMKFLYDSVFEAMQHGSMSACTGKDALSTVKIIHSILN